MRTLAIGDVHGSAVALDGLLAAVAPTAADRLVFLGDYVDRGPDTRGVLDRLIRIRRDFPNAVFLRGNHELMMTRSRTDVSERRMWLSVGGAQALASYGKSPGLAGTLSDIPAAHWEFLDRHLDDYHETDTHIFVHANLDPDLDLADQPDYLLRWEKLEPGHARPHASGKTVVCGHTRQKTGVPLDLGHTVCIDTDVYGAGWLTCLDVGSGKYWQADRDGRVRTGRLGAAP